MLREQVSKGLVVHRAGCLKLSETGYYCAPMCIRANKQIPLRAQNRFRTNKIFPCVECVLLCTQDGGTNITLHNTIWTWFGLASLYLCVPLRWSSSLRRWGVLAGTFSPPGAACPSRSGSYCTDTAGKAEWITFTCLSGITFYIMHIMRKVRLCWPKLYEEEIRGATANGKGQESVDAPEMWLSWAYTVRTALHLWNIILSRRGRPEGYVSQP